MYTYFLIVNVTLVLEINQLRTVPSTNMCYDFPCNNSKLLHVLSSPIDYTVCHEINANIVKPPYTHIRLPPDKIQAYESRFVQCLIDVCIQ